MQIRHVVMQSTYEIAALQPQSSRAVYRLDTERKLTNLPGIRRR
jgi:hypothetical protein